MSEQMNYVSDAEIRELFTAQNKRHEAVTAAIAGHNLYGYPTANGHIMEHSELNRLAARNGMEAPDYKNNPVEVFRRSLLEIGWDMCDQWIPYNSLTMGDGGYENGSFFRSIFKEKYGDTPLQYRQKKEKFI